MEANDKLHKLKEKAQWLVKCAAMADGPHGYGEKKDYREAWYFIHQIARMQIDE